MDITTGAGLLEQFDALERKREFVRPELEQRRTARLLQSANSFFRGTPALFYRLCHAHPELHSAFGPDARWIVGDVHLENIGVICVASQKLVYDFNDLDEAIRASAGLDVLRGATSAALSARELGGGALDVLRAAEAFILSYIRPLAEETPRAIRELLEDANKRDPDDLLDERAPEKKGVRQFANNRRDLELLDEEEPVVEDLFDRYAADCPLDLKKRLRLDAAAFRVQGSGSLGVRRFVMLARDGKKGRHHLLEAKEMRKSALIRSSLVGARRYGHGEAERVEKAMQHLLRDPLFGVRALKGVDGRSYLMRPIAPGETKLALSAVKDIDELLELCRMLGFRLSQAHERSASAPPPVVDAARMLSVALDLAELMTRVHLEYSVRCQATEKLAA